MNIAEAYRLMFFFVLAALCAYACCGIVRAITTKNTACRVLGVNMTSSAVIASVIVLTVLMEESYLADVALLYVLVNFVAVVILNRVFVAANGKNEANEKDKKAGGAKSD